MLQNVKYSWHYHSGFKLVLHPFFNKQAIITVKTVFDCVVTKCPLYEICLPGFTSFKIESDNHLHSSWWLFTTHEPRLVFYVLAVPVFYFIFPCRQQLRECYFFTFYSSLATSIQNLKHLFTHIYILIHPHLPTTAIDTRGLMRRTKYSWNSSMKKNIIKKYHTR